jgi:gliding motility-associated-like protein
VLFQPPIYPGYIWSNGATGATVTFTQPGVYSVTVGDYCHYGSNTLLEDQITITPCSDELTVIITPDQSICPNTSATILATVTGGIEPYNYLWNPVIGVGPGPHTVSPVITTQYTLTVTDAAGTSITVSSTVEVNNDIVSVDLGPDQNLCAGNVILNASHPSAVSYLWSTGSTQPSITVNSAGTYSVTVIGECNSATDEITITPCPPQLNVTLGANQSICPGQQASITANATGGLAPYFYIWTPNIGSGPGPLVVSPINTTTYTVEVIDAAGASVSASTTITINTQSVSVDLGPDTDLCNGSLVLNATSPGATAYSWNTGQSTPTLTVSNPGTYSVNVTGPCNTAADQITVSECIPPLVVTLGDDIVACSGQPFTIQATVSGGTPPYSYSWSPAIANGPGPFTQTVNANTSYLVTVTDAEGTIAADQLNVSIGAAEVSVDLGPDRELCVGVNNELLAFGPNIISYLWSNGSTTESISPTVGGLYWVEVTGACNTDTDSIEVAIVPDGLPEFAREVQLCDGSEVLIGPVLPDNYQIVWSTGEFDPQITVSAGGVYTAQVSTSCGLSTFSLNVEAINCSCDIFVPNAFTPDDNNGINDLFGPVSECDFSEYDFVIFNRWGQLVFRTNDPDKKWNGASTDEAYWGRNTVYVWFLKARQRPGLLVTGPIELNGMVTVIR